MTILACRRYHTQLPPVETIVHYPPPSSPKKPSRTCLRGSTMATSSAQNWKLLCWFRKWRGAGLPASSTVNRKSRSVHARICVGQASANECSLKSPAETNVYSESYSPINARHRHSCASLLQNTLSKEIERARSARDSAMLLRAIHDALDNGSNPDLRLQTECDENGLGQVGCSNSRPVPSYV